MAATKNTLAALWNKKLHDERKPKSSDHGSVISTRSRAPEDKNVQEKEATSRLSKPEEEASGPIELPTVQVEDDVDAKKPMEQEDQRKRKRPLACKEQLEEFFVDNSNPSAAQKASLAEQHTLTIPQVSRWFENRRKKARLAKAEHAGEAAEPTDAKAPEPVVLDDDDADMTAEDQVACHEQVEPPEQAVASIVAAEPAFMPEQQAAPPEAPAAVLAPSGDPAGVSDASRENQLEQLKEEISALEGHVVSCPHPLIPLDKEKFEPSLAKWQVASYLVGCSLPLSEVTQELWVLCKGDSNPESPLTQAAVRNMVIDLAARKSYAAKDAGSDKVDALENKTREFLWQWEVRDQARLPKAHRPLGIQHKKQMQKIAARLTALSAACKALEEAGTGKGAAAKAQKALAKLEKVEKPVLSPNAAAGAAPDASQPGPAADPAQQQEAGGPLPQAPHTAAAAGPAAANAPLPSQGTPKGTPGADAGAQTAGDKAAAAEEKARRAEEREKLAAEKERARQEKQKAAEDKERARVEAAQEKERQRLEKEAQKREKEAERERQRAEKEAAKTGFESRTALSKSRNFMNRFFKTPAKAGAEAEGGSSQPPKTPMSAQTLRHPFHEIFTPAPESARLPMPADRSEAFDEAMAAAKQARVEELVEGMEQILRSWTSRPRHRRIRGLPPSWARMRSAQEHVAEFGRLDKARLWRRKFLWFPRDSKRPAYYGSWSRISTTVRARRPLARDAEVDYEVHSDEEWEEEPEGENLSDEDMEEEEDEVEDSCGDGFVVPNGYISEDEGFGSVQQDLDDLCADLDDEATGAEVAAGGDAVQRDRLRLLNAALDRAARANRPIIITRLPLPAMPSQDSARPSHLTGDPALLSALQPLVLTTKIKIRMLPPPEADDAPADGAAAAAAAETATARGRSRATARDQEELTPDLVQFLLAHPELKAVAKVAKAFTEAHPDRKVVKKWVHNKVKEIAEHSGGAWVIKQPAAAAPPADSMAVHQLAETQEAPASTPPQQRPASADQPPSASQPPTAGDHIAAAARTPATAGPLDKFLRTGSGQQATPKLPAAAVPPRSTSAAAEPKEVVVLDDEDEGDKAHAPMDVNALPPAAAADAPSSRDEIRGTADPIWRELRESLAANSLQVAEKLQKVFGAGVPAEFVRAVPSFVLTAMVKGLASGQCSRLLQSCVLKTLAHIVRMLVQDTDGASRLPTPSKVFRDERSAPVAVSLHEILACCSLLAALQTCARAKQNRPPQLAQPAAQLLAAMLAVDAAEMGISPGPGSQKGTTPALPAAAATAAAELRAHIAGDSAWLGLLADLLGPTNDATVVECVAKALASLCRDAAAASALLACSWQSKPSLAKLLLAAAALAAKSPSKVAMEQCASCLADLLSQKDATHELKHATSADEERMLLQALQEVVSAHLPAEPGASASDSCCLIAALKIGDFVARFNERGLSGMQRLSGPIAAHQETWHKLQVAVRAQGLLDLLNPPQ